MGYLDAAWLATDAWSVGSEPASLLLPLCWSAGRGWNSAGSTEGVLPANLPRGEPWRMADAEFHERVCIVLTEGVYQGGAQMERGGEQGGNGIRSEAVCWPQTDWPQDGRLPH